MVPENPLDRCISYLGYNVTNVSHEKNSVIDLAHSFNSSFIYCYNTNLTCVCDQCKPIYWLARHLMF